MLPLIAAASEHGSKTAFYIAAGLLAVWAVTIGAIGVTQPSFPRGAGQARLVMVVSGLLMVAAMSTAVITAG